MSVQLTEHRRQPAGFQTVIELKISRCTVATTGDHRSRRSPGSAPGPNVAIGAGSCLQSTSRRLWWKYVFVMISSSFVPPALFRWTFRNDRRQPEWAAAVLAGARSADRSVRQTFDETAIRRQQGWMWKMGMPQRGTFRSATRGLSQRPSTKAPCC